MTKLSERLKNLRESFSFTQQYVAGLLGISQPSYVRYEKGTAEPTLANLVKLADIYDVTCDYLLGRAEI